MREMHLYADRKAQPKKLVQSLNSASPITTLRETQGDTLTIFVHQYDRNPSTPPLTSYVEKPLSASAVRASVGYIDAAPQSGTFKLKVGAGTTGALTWPSDLSTPSLIATWKASVLSALNALTSVPSGGARLDDPAGTPAHIFYFTWLDEASTAAIEVVSNRLIPWIEATVTGSVIPVGYSQQVKLARFPLRMSGAFAQATTPPVAIIETRPGSSGVNAEQTVAIPAASAGSFALQWSGAKTKTMDVTTVTAASMAAALNAIVAEGAANPSFRVETRVQREGKRFAVEFIGPLAGAAQAALVPVMYDQQGAHFWTGSLILDGLGLEMALNGAPEVTITFELVITEGGEETYLLPLVIENDMTAPTTAADAEAVGAVFVREATVVVDDSTIEPFASVAAGQTFAPPAAVSAGVALSRTHNLGSRNVEVRVQYQSGLSPEEWRELQLGGEFSYVNKTANTTELTFAFAITGASTSDEWDRRRIKIFIRAPDAVLEIFGTLQTTWEKVRESLPSGTTVAAKFAAIDAALGIVGGSLRINASQIDGLLKAAQIDISSLATSFLTNADILKTLRELVKDSTLIDNIAERLGLSSKFIETLKTLLSTNADIIAAELAGLKSSADFQSLIRELVLDALEAGAQLPAGTIPFFFDAFTLSVPSVHEIVTGVATAPGAGTTSKATQVTDGDVVTTTSSTAPNTVLSPTGEPVYEPLPCAIVGYTIGASIAGAAQLSDWTDGQVRTCSAAVRLRTIGARRGRTFPTGTILGRKNGIVFPVRLASPIAWPTEMEATLIRTTKITSDLLAVSSRFAMAFQIHAQLAGAANGAIQLIIERGVPSAVATDDLYQFAWTSIAQIEIPLDDALGIHSFEVSVARASGGGLTGEYKKWGRAVAWTPPSLPFALRARILNFDIEDVAAAKGSLLIRRPAFTASIVAT